MDREDGRGEGGEEGSDETHRTDKVHQGFTMKKNNDCGS